MAQRKKNKMKIPKRLGGVRVPKPLRRSLRALAQSQSGRVVLAESLAVAGGVLALLQTRRGSRVREAWGRHRGELAAVKDMAVEEAVDVGATVQLALGAAVRTFTDVLRDPSRHAADAGR